MEEIKPEHKPLLDKVRNLYIESGGKPLHKSEEFGLNQFFKSKNGKIEIDFDYGVPCHMYTPQGSYTILGSNIVGDTKKFWELLTQAFNVEILTPQRNDAIVRARSELEYQCCVSGPVIAITERSN